MPAPSTVTIAGCCGPAGTPGLPVASTIDGSRVKDASAGIATFDSFQPSPAARADSPALAGAHGRDPARIPLYTFHASLLI